MLGNLSMIRKFHLGTTVLISPVSTLNFLFYEMHETSVSVFTPFPPDSLLPLKHGGRHF